MCATPHPIRFFDSVAACKPHARHAMAAWHANCNGLPSFAAFQTLRRGSQGPPDAESTAAGRYAIATFTLDCGHQAVELLRQDPDAAPFWVEDGAVDHLAARDARSLTRLLIRAVNLEDAQRIIEAAQANLAKHPEDDDHEDDPRER